MKTTAKSWAWVRSPLTVIITIVIVTLDQITKVLVINSGLDFRGREVVPGFFDLVYTHNTGAAWGIMEGKIRWLGVLSLAVFVAMIYWFHKLTFPYRERSIAISVVMGGIVGNMYDRFFRIGVVDFLSFHLGSYTWPAFNVADSAICVGVFVYVFSSFLRPEPKTGSQETLMPGVTQHKEK